MDINAYNIPFFQVSNHNIPFQNVTQQLLSSLKEDKKRIIIIKIGLDEMQSQVHHLPAILVVIWDRGTLIDIKI